MIKRVLRSPIGLFLAGIAIWVLMSACGSTSEASTDRPNFLLIITDDQRYDTMDFMPRTHALIFDQGATFNHGYITTPRCCPSRASILTGMYAHHHGVLTNDDELLSETLVHRFSREGYLTGLIGKYLNTYPESEDQPPLPEFDTWVNFLDGNLTATYYDTRLNVNGEWRNHEGYQTDILQDYAVEFIQTAAAQDEPFLLIFAPRTPHLPAKPAPGDENLYADLPPFRPPNFDEADRSDKPAWLQALDSLTRDDIDAIDDNQLRQLQSLHALDETIGVMIEELEARGMLDNTMIFYISDNGQFQGEHGILRGKIFAYEPAARVPLGMRYPPLIPAGTVEDRVVANIDIAPTMYELAGMDIPDYVDGRSLAPLFEGTDDWREYILIEGWPTDIAVVGEAPPFQAVHTERYVYVETEGDTSELYDLLEDPYELENQIDNPAYATVLDDMRSLLEAEREQIVARQERQPPERKPEFRVIVREILNDPQILGSPRRRIAAGVAGIALVGGAAFLVTRQRRGNTKE